MIKHIFYYQTGGHKSALPTKVLTTEMPIPNEYLNDLAWDFGTRLTPPRVETHATLTDKERDAEKAAITTAQRGHKDFKNKMRPTYLEARDGVIRAILAAKTPRWGSVRVTVTPAGL